MLGELEAAACHSSLDQLFPVSLKHGDRELAVWKGITFALDPCPSRTVKANGTEMDADICQILGLVGFFKLEEAKLCPLRYSSPLDSKFSCSIQF